MTVQSPGRHRNADSGWRPRTTRRRRNARDPHQSLDQHEIQRNGAPILIGQRAVPPPCSLSEHPSIGNSEDPGNPTNFGSAFRLGGWRQRRSKVHSTEPAAHRPAASYCDHVAKAAGMARGSLTSRRRRRRASSDRQQLTGQSCRLRRSCSSRIATRSASTMSLTSVSKLVLWAQPSSLARLAGVASSESTSVGRK